MSLREWTVWPEVLMAGCLAKEVHGFLNIIKNFDNFNFRMTMVLAALSENYKWQEQCSFKWQSLTEFFLMVPGHFLHLHFF